MALSSFSSFSLPLATFRATNPDLPAKLGVGGIVIHPDPKIQDLRSSSSGRPAALVLQRAPADSHGLKWDIPGGGVDEVPDPKQGPGARADPDIISACKREVFEETGLHVSKVVDVVYYHEWQKKASLVGLLQVIEGWAETAWNRFPIVGSGSGSGSEAQVEGVESKGRSGWTGKFTFLVEVEEIQGRLAAAKTARGMSNLSSGEKDAEAEVDEELDVVIKLSEQEHQAYRWITEDEVDGYLSNDGDVIDFISRNDLQSVKAAFTRWNAARAVPEAP